MGVSNSAVELTLIFRLQSGCWSIRGSGKYYICFVVFHLVLTSASSRPACDFYRCVQLARSLCEWSDVRGAVVA